MTAFTVSRPEGLAPWRSSSGAVAMIPLRRTGLQACGTRRGLSLLELLMAVIITAMVGVGIAGMLGAVSSGVGTRKDNREIMVRSHAAQCRLAAYLAISQCVLASSGSEITIWLADSRQSNTVHASEVRWLRFNSVTGEFTVDYVDFPAGWTKTASELADLEYPSDTNWETVRAYYSSKGLLTSRALVDDLLTVAIRRDHNDAMAARHITFDLEFEGENVPVPVQVSGTIQNHAPPLK